MTKNTNPPSPEGEELGFLQHLLELRDRLLHMVLAIGIVFLILMPFAQDLYNLLSDPLVRHLPAGQKLIAVGVASPFFIPYKLALMVAFVLALPYVLYQLWGFIAPGLYQHEKKLVTPLLVSSVALFYLGMAFAYFVVLPMMFSILPNFAPSNVDVTPDIAEYLDFVMMMFMAFGIGFEMPVATLLLISTGIASRETLKQSRPYVVVGAFIIGMFLTPPDVLSQVMLAVPMWLLFEVGLLASVLFEKQLKQASAARDARDMAEDQHDIKPPPPPPATSSAATTTTGATSNDTSAWENDRHIFEETTPTPSTDDEAFHPLTDEEMEAELERMDEEFKRMEDKFRKEEQDKQDKGKSD
ncbi:twin-arginine translocase subunit TatC [Thiothrix litoralis]|uniref:Sec-independent protein translocase protein TatC n=1 Tax=Thiothrix litoralis TaxID=2891210 RepID=A0ABX7WYE2_9GAMM|nr:twin-arginine translocase subunit TatC [Thiothrix litoralis]QTR45945.1 twin-arginine translocase subunit TatC [Thiothrix litoralis]